MYAIRSYYEPRLAGGPLGHAHHGDPLHLQLLQHAARLVHLTPAAVDEQHIGQPPLPRLETGVAARERLSYNFV